MQVSTWTFIFDHYGNGYSRLFRYGEFGDQAVFNPNGKGYIKAFADEYLPNYEKTKVQRLHQLYDKQPRYAESYGIS